MKPKISIIIVHYRVKQTLFNCLKSIKANPPKASYEVIVVDNDEKPVIQSELKRKFKWVRYFKSPGNTGYGAGNNLGAKQAKGSYLFILNPDIILSKHSLNLLVDFLDSNKTTAIAAPLLTNHKGKPYPLQGTSQLTPLKGIFALSFLNKLFPHNPISLSYWVNSKSLTKNLSVATVPGSAFLIRKSAFLKIGQFDENFFLYFEESDLGKRLTDKGFKLYIVPQAKVIHHWAAVTPKSTKIKQIFNQSRYLYFKKHFGLLPALTVELFSRLSLINLSFILILLLAAWLRFYKLGEFMTFIGDQGRDYLAARDMLLTGKLPLVGIPSSVPWLHQGVFFIWLTALALKIGNFNPLAPAVMTSIIGVMTVFLTYVFASHWFGKKSGLVATLVAATSPLMVIHSRMPYHISPIPLVSLIFIFSIYLYLTAQINFFWPVFIWAVLLQFELTTLPLILLIPFFWYLKKKKPTKKHLTTFLLASVIPFIPKIIYDFTHGFKQTLGFAAWAGYRILSFFGFKGQHTFSFNSFLDVNQTIFIYWQKFISWGNTPIATTFAIIIFSVFVFRLRAHRKTSLEFNLIFTFIFLNFLAFYFHQGPSEAYFPVLFPAWILAIAWTINYLKKPIIAVFFIFLSIYNSIYLVKNDFLSYGPILTERIQTARLIKSQSSEKSFKLKNHSATKQFNSHLDNYRYLLWWINSPENSKSSRVYTIYDGDLNQFKPASGTSIYYFPNSLLIKHD